MEYIIAGIRIAVPQEFTAGSFGTALAPFAAADEGPADLSVETRGEIRQADGYRELDEFDFADADADCRFGRDSEGYLLTMTPRDGCAAARFRKAFGAPLVTTDVTLRHNPALFRFGLWSMFNIAAVARQAVAIHSSVISLNGGAVLFLGESGTGKSTHTRLWREHIPGAELLNDDSPIVRIVQTADADPICGAVQNPANAPAAAAETPDASAATTGAPKPQAMVFGAPWSGKTPCYRNVCQPIRAIVRLSQAPHNRIRRLRAIEEFSDLGSGFNIAMQDLDIRGAGNLLGAEQSGFIADIGFETYQKIMNEAIAELRAEGLQVAGLGAAEQDVVEQMHYVDDAHIEIEVEAGLPDAYVAQQAERLKLYRELDSTKDEAALQAFESRLADRFGPLPREAQELLNVVRLRWEAIRLGIERVKVKNGLMILHFVGEQNSPYYKSDTFMELLRKVTQNPARFVLKQHNNRLAMTVRNVKDIEDGYKTLQQL